MNELYFANRIRQQLNRGVHELRPETLSRLESARMNALARQKLTVRQSALATAGSFVHFQLESPGLKQFLAALALLLGLVITTYWHADQRITELETIDSALLSDDLPIGAFTDRGFNAWLKRNSPE